MTLSDVGSAISKSAPLLATALLGPAAGSVVGMITSIFGGDIKDPQDILKRITTDPTAQIKLAEIEANNKIKLQELEIDRLQIEMDDIASARQREADLAKAGIRDNTPRILAMGYTLAYFIFLLMQYFIPESRNDAILSCLSSGEVIILTYYYGSSHKKG